MVKRVVLAACFLALVAVGAVADQAPASVNGYTMTPERAGAIVAILVGLFGAVVGGRALVHAHAVGKGLNGGTVALAAGMVSMILGGMIVATADGGLGTGNGLGGGVVALVVGPISLVLGGLARARSRGAR